MKKLLVFISLLLVHSNFAQESDQTTRKQSFSGLVPISITIGGNFIINGSLPAYTSQRLDNFITAAYLEGASRMRGSINQPETLKNIEGIIEKYPLRNIVVKRLNGEKLIVDLLKFRLTGDFTHNPYLQNDDVIVFPSYDEERNFVDVIGAVNKPIKFQFVEGDKLSDAILLAGGINISYDSVKTAEISRLNSSGDKEEIVHTDINSDFSLKRGDRIKILANENRKYNYKALVLGEVKYPGYIFISKDNTTLKEVLGKAGGFNTNADLDRSQLIRNDNAVDVLKKYWMSDGYLNNAFSNLDIPNASFKLKMMEDSLSMLRLNTLTDEDVYYYFAIDNALRILNHEQIVDFSNVFKENSDESKFIVNDGDVILIPNKFEYVYVFGQVPKTGYVKHSFGKDYKYYIEKAGGKTETAYENDDDIAIIKAKDKNWIKENKEKVNIQPGDFIYVPKDVPHTFNYYLTRIGSVASVVGTVATIVLLLIQFGK